MKTPCLLFTLFNLLSFALSGQADNYPRQLHGEWLLSTHFYSFQGPGSGTINYKETFDKFRIVKFDSTTNKVQIRTGDTILRDATYRVWVDTRSPRHRTTVTLTNSVIKGSADDWYYDLTGSGEILILTPDTGLASEGYWPGSCTQWDNYYKLGSGFLSMKMNRKNKRLLRRLVRDEKQIWKHEKPLETME